ncbi:MAG: preprotein translocase subunit SecE [Bacilli bacterium]|nr:preprotein translocase subunit SecE [Bacilli bacterium]MDD4406536.1 preprotein translocase subunit SecE [Bacilli bacterium]
MNSIESSKKAPKSKNEKSFKKEKDSIFKQIKDEMKKVRWPDKNEMLKYSIATIIFIIAFGLYFFGLDIIFAWIKEIID